MLSVYNISQTDTNTSLNFVVLSLPQVKSQHSCVRWAPNLVFKCPSKYFSTDIDKKKQFQKFWNTA